MGGAGAGRIARAATRCSGAGGGERHITRHGGGRTGGEADSAVGGRSTSSADGAKVRLRSTNTDARAFSDVSILNLETDSIKRAAGRSPLAEQYLRKRKSPRLSAQMAGTDASACRGEAPGHRGENRVPDIYLKKTKRSSRSWKKKKAKDSAPPPRCLSFL